MIPAIYIRYALEEYAVGEFVNNDGSSRGYNDTSAGGYGTYPSAQFMLKDFFEPLGEIVSNSLPIRYHYIQCNTNPFYEQLYILDSADAFDTPSTSIPDDIVLYDLTVQETVDYLKLELGVDFIYGYVGVWLNSWTQIRNTLKQFYDISKKMNLRTTHMYKPDSLDAVFTKRTIIRDGITGSIISDVTTPSPFQIVYRELLVNGIEIVTSETIYSSTRTFQMIDDRAINYNSSKCYYDAYFAGETIDSYTLYNYTNHDIISDNEYEHIPPDPREYMDISDAGTYSSTVIGGETRAYPNREVSEIKEMTLQMILLALGAPANQVG